VWLVYYKKHTGKLRIPYDDAVEEALCYGWIDTTIKRLDDERYMQRFTPRKPRSVWSKLNKERAGNPEPTTCVPPELKKALAANKAAARNFDNLAPSYRRQYIGWFSSARPQETRGKRLKEIVSLLSRNKKMGMR